MLRIPATLCTTLLLALGVTACGGDDDADTGEAPPVSTIEGPVALADFCDTYNQLYCTASADCCSPLKQVHESVEACIAANPCPAVIGDPLVHGAVLAYDADKAGDFLRRVEAGGATCEVDVDEVADLDFLQGTVPEGGDCSPVVLGDGRVDRLPTKTCAPGLTCAVQRLGDDDAAREGTCQPAVAEPAPKAVGEACDVEVDSCAGGFCDDGGTCLAKQADGAACTFGDACLSGRCLDADGADEVCLESGCTCAASADLFCPAELPQAPANTDWSDIYQLCISASGCGTCGSSKPTKLKWKHSNKNWECTIDSIDRGERKCCNPVRNGGGGNWGGSMIVNGSDNGLRVTRAEVSVDNKRYILTDFDQGTNTGLKAEGCNWRQENCGSFWVDQDGHGRCERVGIRVSDDYSEIWCND